MSVKQIIKKLEEEIKGKNRKEKIKSYEELLIENIEDLSQNENFFNLPLNSIFSLISKVDFNTLEENDEIIEIIQNIIKNKVSLQILVQFTNLSTKALKKWNLIFFFLNKNFFLRALY